MKKVRRVIVWISLFLLLMSCCSVGLAMGRSEMEEKERIRMDTFFSNFAEVFLPEFSLDAPDNAALINFGVRHIYINRYHAVKRLDADTMGVSLEDVQNAVRKYFGRAIIAQSTTQHVYKYGYFHLTPAEGEFAFAQVLELKKGEQGIWHGKVAVYQASGGFAGNVHGTIADWKKTDPELIPELSAVYRVKVSVSPEDADRFILREYVK